jgi:hypothetical protein
MSDRANIPVIVSGKGLPEFGRRWDAYKTACIDLHLDRSQAQRNSDREELKAGRSLNINGYLIKRTV